MKIVKLLPFLLIAACSSEPSKEESIQVFAAATASMSSTQSRATLGTSGNATLEYTGACILGGSFSVIGSYLNTGAGGERTTFDLTTTFDNCNEGTGTLDGSMQWTSVADGNYYSASMVGDLAFSGSNVDTSCAFDLHMTVEPVTVTYSGSVCGYDIAADLDIRTGT